MKKTLLMITLLTTLPIGSAFAHGAGVKNGCNPLAANACDKGKVCYTEASIKEILQNTNKYQCQNQDQCGEGATCVGLDGYSIADSSQGQAQSGMAQVCIPKGECIDTSLYADFDAYIPSEYQFELDLDKCVGKLTNKDTQLPDNSKVEQFTAEVMHFTLVLEHATTVMDDWFGINKQGKAFAVTFNQRREAAQEAYIAARAQLEAYLEKIKSAAAKNEIDMASSVAYYGVMADIYELEAHTSAEFVNQFAEVYTELDKWKKYIATPAPNYYSVGKDGDTGLGVLVGKVTSSGDGDSGPGGLGEFEDKLQKSGSKGKDIPVYQLKINICGQVAQRNGDCVKMCEHEGVPVVDPVIETEKVKKDPGFLGLGRLFCEAGNFLGGLFGSDKKEDCKYEYLEQIPDHFAQYANSATCSYIAKDPAKSAAQNKIETVNIIREKVANLTNYYEANYKMNSELAGCMKLIAGEVSSSYDGGFSGNLNGDGNTSNNNKVEGGPNADVDLSGSAVNSVSPISGGSGALSAYRQKLKEAMKNSAGASSLDQAGLDPLSSESGKNALNKKLSKFASDRAESKKKSDRFVNTAKSGGVGSSAYRSIQDFRQIASNLNVAVDSSRNADLFKFGSLSPQDYKSNSLLSNSGKDSKNSDSLSGSGQNGSNSLNGADANAKAALAKGKNAADAAAKAAEEKARKLRLAKKGKGSGSEEGGLAADGSLINGEKNSDDENGKKKVAKSDKEGEEEELVNAEDKTDVPLPPNFDEYDLANMLNDVQSDQYKYSRRADDSLWDIITKTYMRSAIKTIYGDRAAASDTKAEN